MILYVVCRTVLLEKPDVVVGTPSRMLVHLQQRVSITNLHVLSSHSELACNSALNEGC